MRESHTWKSKGGDQLSLPATADCSASTILRTPQRLPQRPPIREQQRGTDLQSPSQTDVNGITFQLNNIGQSIYVPQASTARTIHFDGKSEEYDHLENEGYNSDGGLGPFYYAVAMEEAIDDYVKESVKATTAEELCINQDGKTTAPVTAKEVLINQDGETTNEEEGTHTDAPTDQEGDPQLTVDNITTLKVKELREELQKHGLSKIGLKQAQQKRLKEAVLNNIPVVIQVAGVGGPADTIPNADDGWLPGSRWVSLTPEVNTVEDVRPNGYYAPTDASDLRFSPKKRYNFKKKLLIVLSLAQKWRCWK